MHWTSRSFEGSRGNLIAQFFISFLRNKSRQLRIRVFSSSSGCNPGPGITQEDFSRHFSHAGSQNPPKNRDFRFTTFGKSNLFPRFQRFVTGNNCSVSELSVRPLTQAKSREQIGPQSVQFRYGQPRPSLPCSLVSF